MCKIKLFLHHAAKKGDPYNHSPVEELLDSTRPIPRQGEFIDPHNRTYKVLSVHHGTDATRIHAYEA